MRLDHATWIEVDDYLKDRTGIILPTGSTEQHGPIGLIGTDAICATTIAERVADIVKAYVAPPLVYTPAPFNMSFPGTVSLSVETFSAMATEVLSGLASHGFRRIYVLNGHGANLVPLQKCAENVSKADILLKSWWDFEPVNQLRHKWYGNWEGMHATPSEVSITQAVGRQVTHPAAEGPPRRLTPDFISRHAGDRHGPPDEHRTEFPDGRVGSHSSLARPEHGQALIHAAAEAVAGDFIAFCSDGP